MLSVELYEDRSSLYSLNFIQNTELPTVIVCPNPTIADELREKLSDQVDISTITVTKFIQDKLKRGWKDLQIFRKADLLVHLSTVWKHYFPELSIEMFQQTFTLFTELRSYTTSFDLVSEILEEFDTDIANALKVFWAYSDQIDLVDEHRAYGVLAEAYRENEHEVHSETFLRNPFENVIIWGFSHLSAGQVDLVKALSIRHDVYVPFSKSIYEKASPTDWICWVLPKGVSDNKKIENATAAKSCKVISFPKNRLAETMRAHTGDHCELVDVFLATKNPSFDQLSEIPLGGMEQKSSVDLFSSLLSGACDQVDKNFWKEDESAQTSDVVEFIDGMAATELKLKNFRQFKVLALLKQSIVNWKELSNTNDTMIHFDFRVIQMVSELGIPRNYSLALIGSQVKGRVKGLEGLESARLDRENFFCITSGYGPLKGSGTKYSEKITTFLSTIGPIQRKDLEFWITQELIDEILQHENTTVFLENGLLESDLGWSEVFRPYQDSMQVFEVDRPEVLDTPDYLTKITKKERHSFSSVSAKRLQDFIDCPRKYYFNYVDKLRIEPILKTEVGANILGTIEHDIIGEYLEKYSVWNSDKHLEIVEEKLQSKLAEENIDSSKINYEKWKIELITLSKNGIESVLSLNSIGAVDLSFEKELEDEVHGLKVRGSVDCFASTANDLIILDFKRSKGGIPSQTDLLAYEKVQLWFYLHHLKLQATDIGLFGFINLTSIDESLVFASDKAAAKEYSDAGVLPGVKIKSFKDDLSSLMSGYIQYEDKCITRLLEETGFEPTPRSADVCKYCQLANICPRGVE